MLSVATRGIIAAGPCATATAAKATATAGRSFSFSRGNTTLQLLCRHQRSRHLLLSSDNATLSTSTASSGPQKLLQVRPVRRKVSKEERAALRAARKERATSMMQQQQQQQQLAAAQDGVAAAATSTTTTAGTTTATAASTSTSIPMKWSSRFFMPSRWIWYVGVGLPAGLLIWGFNDENSPPAKVCEMIGLTDWIRQYTEEYAKPSHEKLLPSWTEIPNVPHDIPVPHTLVLDLEKTLVCSTWDRKHGWRHAKRPGVDKFLHDMAQYYEIVLYSPSVDGVADPVVSLLDKDGCIMHRLYRDATYYINGVHVKDLDSLNRNVKRMIVLDDDPEEVQMHPQNLIRVKPYTDPTDRKDNTLSRITPFLMEIVRDGHSDIPALLEQYRGMDADEIANEQDRRIHQLREDRERRSQRGLAGLALGRGSKKLPEPALPAMDVNAMYSSQAQQLTAKDIAGAAPPPPGSAGGSTTSSTEEGGLVGWMQRRAKEKEEHQMRKMEKWNEIMMKKQREKQQRQAEEQQRAAAAGAAAAGAV